MLYGAVSRFIVEFTIDRINQRAGNLYERKMSSLIVLVLSLLVSVTLAVDDCKHSMQVRISLDLKLKAGEICKIHVDDLLPTQFAIGLIETQCKKGKIESKSKSELKEWLQEYILF